MIDKFFVMIMGYLIDNVLKCNFVLIHGKSERLQGITLNANLQF